MGKQCYRRYLVAAKGFLFSEEKIPLNTSAVSVLSLSFRPILKPELHLWLLVMEHCQSNYCPFFWYLILKKLRNLRKKPAFERFY